MTKAEALQQLIDAKNPTVALQRLLSNVQAMKGNQGDKGDKGDQGEPGYTPVKGQDYFTEAEINFIIKFIQDRVKDGAPGLPGKDGINGRSAIRGIDFWTPQDQEKILQSVLSKIEKPKDGVSPRTEDVVNQVVDEIKKNPPHLQDIKGTKELIEFLKAGGFRGGGGISNINGLVSAGSGISVGGSGTTTDPYTITNSGVTSANGITGALTLVAGTNIILTPAGNNITINSTGGLSIGQAVSGGTDTQILFVHPGGTLAQSANFTYDDTAGFIVNNRYTRLGNATPNNTVLSGGPSPGMELWGDDNTINGCVIGTGNKNSGTSAYNGFFLNNDLAIANDFSHFAGIFLNSSNYTDTSFGTLLAVKNQCVVQNTDGPILIAATNTTAQVVNIAVGGTSTSNIVATFGKPNGGSTSSNFFNVIGTLPAITTTGAQGVLVNITSAGSSAQQQVGFKGTLATGYTGSASTFGFNFSNGSAGTGTSGFIGSNGNYAGFNNSNSSGSGNNVGSLGTAQGSTSLNLGVIGRAVSTPGSALNVGVAGFALTSSVTVGGFFGLMNTAPTLGTSAALIADNGAVAADIFEARDNGSVVFKIGDGGATTVNTTLTTGTATTLGQGTTLINGNVLGGASQTDNFLNITGTLPTTMTAATSAVNLQITSAGSSAFIPALLRMNLLGGYTGPNTAYGVFMTNSATSSAQGGWTTGNNIGNVSMFTNTNGATSGDNVGNSSNASQSSHMNLGVRGAATSGGNSAALNIGVGGLALLATVNVAGFFGLMSTAPTLGTTCALIADNGATGADILQARQNGTVKWNLNTNGVVATYNGVATAGVGTPAIYGVGRSVAQTAAVASVATYTVGASDGSFEVSANVLVTTATLHNFTVTLTYTDEGSTSRTVTMPFSVLAGTFVTAITNASGAVPYEGLPMHIRCLAGSTITIATTGTFTTVTYNVEGIIKQMA